MPVKLQGLTLAHALLALSNEQADLLESNMLYAGNSAGLGKKYGYFDEAITRGCGVQLFYVRVYRYSSCQ